MKTNLLVTISLFIFWAGVVSILTSWLVLYQVKKENINGVSLYENAKNFLPNETADMPPLANANANAGGGKILAQTNIVLSGSEITRHNNQDDCWLIMDGKVYDVTNYLDIHPGGPGTILPFCGKDASAAFAGLSHSSGAENLLASYYLGDLGQALSIPDPSLTTTVKSSSKTPVSGSAAASKQKPPRRWYDDDEDGDD